MDSFNFTGIIFHPNTQQLLSKTQKQFIAMQKNVYPVFPMFGIFSNMNFLLSSEIQSTNTVDSKMQKLKKMFSSLVQIQITKIVKFNNTFFFVGDFTFLEQKKSTFYIPLAIEKIEQEKTLTSIFNYALSLTKKSQKSFLDSDFFRECNFNFEPISFRTFQIAEIQILNNQYKAYKNFWVKTTA